MTEGGQNMKYKVEWTLSGSTFIEADNALDAALAVSDYSGDGVEV